MSSNQPETEKANVLIKILSPQQARICWLPNSGNQVAFEVCNKILNAGGASNRQILLVDGVGGSGLSYLLLALEKSLRRDKKRVLSILEGVVEEEGCLLSNLIVAVGAPFSAKKSRELGGVMENVLKLRCINVIIIHDFQRFTSIEDRQSCINLDVLVYLMDLLPKCNFILGGTSSALDMAGIFMAGHSVERISLQPMTYDQDFISFVDSLAALYLTDMNDHVVDAKDIYAITGGLVGETAVQIRLMGSQA